MLDSSPHRIQPPCPVFLKCGGCSYQHIDYAHQLRIKENQLREALRRLGGLVDPPVAPMIPSPDHFGYRNRITVHVKGGVVGFFAQGSNNVVPVETCLIASAEVQEGFRDLLKSRPNDGNYLIGERKRYGGFRQVNNAVADILKRCVSDAVSPLGEDVSINKLLVDAYCGGGFFAHELGSFFERVVGIERSIASVAMATRQAASNEEYLAGTVEQKLPTALYEGPPERTVLLLDPPSEGLADEVTETILGRLPAKIVYVSCNPATLARDARRLTAKYKLISVSPVDMFPQTAEIESVSLFKLRK